MAENKREQDKDTNAANAQKESAPKSVDHQRQAQRQPEQSTQADNKPNEKKRERFREFLKRWKILLQLIVPSIFSLGVLAVIGVQAWIYSGQLEQMRISTDANKKAADAATSAAKSAEESLAIAQKNIALAQTNTELSQKTVELTQKSLESTQEALGYANKANEISEKGMEAANTAWIDVSIKDVRSLSKDRFDINYYIENHSAAPATRIFAECYLEKSFGIDENVFSESNIAIMPNQTVETHSRILVIKGEVKTIVNEINDGKMGIKVYVTLRNAMGKKTSFIETFYKTGGRFTVTNTQFNPSQTDIIKLIKGNQPK
jgi:hypothetical protein